MNLNATLFFQMIVFFVLGWFTMKFVWPPLTKAMDDRRQKIADGLAAADKGKADLAQAQARISLIEASAKTENHARMVEAEKQAAVLIDQARREGEAEKARIIAQAQQDAAQEAQRVRESLRADVAILAVKGAEHILKREVDAQAHAELLNQLQGSTLNAGRPWLNFRLSLDRTPKRCLQRPATTRLAWRHGQVWYPSWLKWPVLATCAKR